MLSDPLRSAAAQCSSTDIATSDVLFICLNQEVAFQYFSGNTVLVINYYYKYELLVCMIMDTEMHLLNFYFTFLLSLVCVQTDTELHSKCYSLERRNNWKLNNACF